MDLSTNFRKEEPTMTKEQFLRKSFSLTPSADQKLNYIVRIGGYANQSDVIKKLIDIEYRRCYELEEKQLREEEERIRARRLERQRESAAIESAVAKEEDDERLEEIRKAVNEPQANNE